MQRFKNYGLWVALAALIGMVLQDAGVSIAPDRYEAYVDLVLGILAAAGVISSPEKGKWFGDK